MNLRTSPWHLRMFGGVVLRAGDHVISEFETKRAAKLLVLLSCSRNGTMRREELADLLWPDDFLDSTRLRLRQELSRLRRALGSPETLISSTAETIHLDQAQVFNDWDLLAKPETLHMDEMLTMLSGDYLPGWDDPWVIARRTAADAARLSAAKVVVRRLIDETMITEAQLVAEAALRLAPKDESLRNLLMTLDAAQGRESPALATYRSVQQAAPSGRSVSGGDGPMPSFELPQIPHPIDRFYGRQRALEEIVHLLADDDIRLVTITGTGGIGKTRLAIEAVKRCSGIVGFVSFVEYSKGSDPSDYLAERIFSGGAPPHPITALKRQLQSEPCLLVFDNLEVLEDAGGFVASLLSSIPSIRLLVTSRGALRIAGEYAIRLGPLEKSSEGLPMLESLLGAQRIPVEQLGSLEEIVDLCAGIPLTLRLAASRLHTMEPKELVVELRSTLSPLVAHSSDLPERHRNLETMLRLAVDSLMEEDRQLLKTISFFPGGVTRAIVRSIVGPAVDDLLERLLDSALIWMNDNVSPLRFELLEPIRQFLRSSMPPEEVDAFNQQFLSTMQAIALSFQSVRALPSEEERVVHRREATNFRAAMSLALEIQPEIALSIFCRIWDLEIAAGRSGEMRELTKRLETQHGLTALHSGHMRLCLAWSYSIAGDLDTTIEYARMAKEFFEIGGNPIDACMAEILAFECQRNFMEWEAALDGYEDLLGKARQLDPGLVAIVQAWRGRALIYRNEWDSAIVDLEASFSAAREYRNLSIQIMCAPPLLFVDFARGDFERLQRRIVEFETIHAQLDDPYSWSIFLRAVARIELSLGNFQRGEELAKQSDRLFRYAENVFQEVQYRMICARAQIRLGRFEEAHIMLEEIGDFITKVLPRVQCPVLAVVAEYHWHSGERAMAKAIMGEAKALIRDRKVRLEPVDQPYFDEVSALVPSEATLVPDDDRLRSIFRITSQTPLPNRSLQPGGSS